MNKLLDLAATIGGWLIIFAVIASPFILYWVTFHG